ncbi:3-hydroxybutyryl-CoA dehydrogenase [Oceanobacillus kimchii]|uniref:3-hydroxybutyryl-CoA dehydrogenase n=1 Tax=Oceanobacillus kimchii TaxID=746691 RepID=A0ABQ5TMZ8_9BACI|nr:MULTISPECIES: 3-hydroxybutyryl-CoA dehydrogenase [Oceanobacillus]MBT2599476.1 3-hydroxybutyryl-CoA dehydrogenase [Oceanobacillus sp. ISL-74]MCT1576662.1 3-hydroxybutyryl-CoA dehydrogenase [Oceanobacillus kimchii]MCT2134732.1 3-hydroxybutyryl-CoA dehydrogenase [Oceanobacillus kimchii]OEH56031.1 3-hydroxybutyryl-CoA dehydrogenase [Oceanobacillus sp. E9]GLO67696.1 putative 3-hydroxybutyryl-CoA dehydrogenase [Oceanobacillus kimchii]
MNIRNVMVVGAGQMGAGIALVCARSGYHVYLFDKNKEARQRGYVQIEKILEKDVTKDKMSETDKIEALNRITLANTIEEVANCDIAIEAVVENMNVKISVFQELDKHAPSHAILASNTSSLPITEIAAETTRPEQVIGMHFMNPVPIMKLVEIIRGLETSDETYQLVHKMSESLGKSSVEVRDFPGFVANRVLMPMINEAVYTVFEGVASPQDVDQVMKLGMNHPMGPLQLADFIGLDTCLYIMEVLHEGFGDSKYRPCPLLRQYVKAGRLGKKVGRGFYTYD